MFNPFLTQQNLAFRGGLPGVLKSPAGPGYEGSFLLLENGDFFLLENGDKLILETTGGSQVNQKAFLLLEDGNFLLLETGDKLILEV